MRVLLQHLADVLDASDDRCPAECLNRACRGISTDTRTVTPGSLFVALAGENFDGHDFVSAARDRGAIAVLVQRPLEDPDLPQLVVPDTLAAYQRLGRWWRDTHAVPVVGITGSVGKTTTKELVAAVLGIYGNVLKTHANFNNEIGVPKTLLQLNDSHTYAVVEMAMRGAGQIAELTHIARPDIAVITNVGTAHIGLLGSRAAIASAKCELLHEMPQTGTAILNADNPLLLETAAQVWSGRTVTYGLENGDLRGNLIDASTLELEGVRYPLPLPGRHNALNYLAAIAVARQLKLDTKRLTHGLAVSVPGGRSKREALAGDLVFLDESYNAGLESMQAALELLAQTPGDRHIAVLGTMKELGASSLAFHRQVGETAKRLGLDAVFVLAELPEAEAIADGARGLPLVDLENLEAPGAHEALAERIAAFLQPGDRVLFKASNSVGLNRAIAAVKARLQGSQDASLAQGD